MSRSKNLLIFFVKYLVISKKSSTFAPGFERDHYMVAIAQLAEHRIVVPSVVGSSPTSHPKETTYGRLFLWLVAWREPIKRGVVVFFCTFKQNICIRAIFLLPLQRKLFAALAHR